MDLLALIKELAISHQHYAFNISYSDDKIAVTLIDFRRLKHRQVKHFCDNNVKVIINKLMNYFNY